jgi:dihydrodipicolinate synthase/N-acetylneuraminate lyase
MATNGRRWTWDKVLTGVVPPVISVLDNLGGIDEALQRGVCEHILADGSSGLFVLGGCGEGAWLTPDQRASVVRYSVAAAAGRAPVIAGVMLPATALAVDAAKRAADAGADGLVAGSPYYNSVDSGAHLRHIEAILDATPLPILLYNIPQSTHHMLSVATVAALSREARILGIKDSSGQLEHFQALIQIKQSVPHFRVLQGAEFAMAATALLGGDGAVPGMGNFAPSLFRDLFEQARLGNSSKVSSIQAQIIELTKLHGLASHWLPSLKGACRLIGLGNGRPAAPLLPASDAELAAIREAIVPHLPAHLRTRLHQA